ncbi:MAG: glycosyltransferase [Mycobacterium kyogaense]|uniref:glycosyltransferase n=1 Tax=Mycobacterium kyogaense TaxID=2212479 RepID=UPI002FFBA68E
MCTRETSLQQIVVVVPAHNEIERLPECLRALITAALCVSVPVLIVAVLDACDDGSEQLAGQFGPDVHLVSVDAGNVGAARAAGFEYARTLCDDGPTTWYATTDADSVVSSDWLIRMTSPGADMVLGIVRFPLQRSLSDAATLDFQREYDADGPGHSHVHGANMGFRASAYWQVGGFRALATAEDADLVERFLAARFLVHRDRELSVATSDRIDGRAPDGFAADLKGLSEKEAS